MKRPTSDALKASAKAGVKAGVTAASGHFGYDLVRRSAPQDDLDSRLPDLDPSTAATLDAVRGYTLTPPERVVALCEAVRYVVEADIPGALVECGVWRGGSSLAMVRTLLSLGVTDRDVVMFDTFDKMPAPGLEDVDLNGVPASRHHQMLERGEDYDHQTYDYLPFGEVQALLRSTRYPANRLHFVQGLVEETLPARAPSQAALVRLDTDYYSSTRHELEHLFPLIAPGGVLLIDDYGHFLGCRQAVEEYRQTLAASGRHLLLHRIDYSARIAVVPAAIRPITSIGALKDVGSDEPTRDEPVLA